MADLVTVHDEINALQSHILGYMVIKVHLDMT